MTEAEIMIRLVNNLQCKIFLLDYSCKTKIEVCNLWVEEGW